MLKKTGAIVAPAFAVIQLKTSGTHPHNPLETMSLRSVDSATYDAWRVAGCLSVFLFSITSACLIFSTENEQAMRRCVNTDATKQECLLTVYGR